MGKLKMRLLALALAAFVLTLLTQGTLAYYSTLGTATNVVTSGDIRFFIRENTDAGTEFPADGVYVIPGDVVSKQVRIHSDCAHPFYLRVKMVYGVDAAELPDEECFKLNVDTANWELHEGWYYYKQPVGPGEITPAVFSHVEIVGDKVDNRYIGKTLSLSVKAQAVQSENNPLTGEAVYTASGWPEEVAG